MGHYLVRDVWNIYFIYLFYHNYYCFKYGLTRHVRVKPQSLIFKKFTWFVILKNIYTKRKDARESSHIGKRLE